MAGTMAPPAAPDAPPPEGGNDVTAAPEAPPIPAKFANEDGTLNQDAMLTSYKALEQKLSSAPPPDTGIGLEGGKTKVSEDATPEEIVKAAGLEVADIVKRFDEKGELTNGQYEALKGQGIPKGVANRMMKLEVQVAKQKGAELRAYATEQVGGEEQLANLLAWAKSNLSEAETLWYQSQVGDSGSGRIALDWLHAKYKNSGGTADEKSLISGSKPAGPGKPFATQSEFMKARSDPKYGTDPEYTASVDQRMLASPDADKLPY